MKTPVLKTWKFLLRQSLSFILCLQLVFSPMVSRAQTNSSGMSSRQAFGAIYNDFIDSFRNADRFSPVNIFDGSGLRGANLWLEGSDRNGKKITEHNRYRTGLGLSVNDNSAPRPTSNDFRSNINRLPLMFSENFSRSPEYRQLMQTEAGRTELLRQYRWTIDALSVAKNANYLEAFNAEKESLRPQVQESMRKNENFKHLFTNSNSTSVDRERHVRTILKMYERFLPTHLEAHGEAAKNLIRADQKYLNNSEQRARYNVRVGISPAKALNHGLRNTLSNLRHVMPVKNMNGRLIAEVEDPFGKGKVRTDFTASRKELARIHMPSVISSIKSGVVTAGKYTPILGGILYIVNQIQFLTNYEENPTRMEDLLQEFTTPGFYLAMFGFFLGGSAGSAAQNALFSNIRSVSVLHSFSQTGELHANRPQTRRLLQSANISAMSYSGLAAGLFTAKVLHQWANKLHACNQLFLFDDNDGDEYRSTLDPARPLAQARIPAYKKTQLEQLCQKNFLEFVNEVASDQDTWARMLSLFNARALFVFYNNWRTLTKLGKFPEEIAAQTSKTKDALKIVSRGFRAPIWGFLIGGLMFYAVAELSYLFVIKPTFDYYNKEFPLQRFKSNLIDLAEEYKGKNFDPDEICKEDQFLNGTVRGTVHQIGALFTGEETERCGLPLFDEFLDRHMVAEVQWRNHLLNSTSNTITKWMQYTSQAMNIYRASKLFYKDIYEQVRIMREQGQPVLFPRRQDPKNPTLSYDDPIGSLDFHDHPLPLFRSSPFFGWDVVLPGKTSGGELAQVTHDAIGVEWANRYQENHGVDRLQARMNSFSKTVLPEVRKETNRALRLVYNEKNNNEGREYKQTLQGLTAVAEGLRSPDLQQNFYALELISYYQALEVNKVACRTPEDYSDLNSQCPFSFIQTQFLDDSIWRWSPRLKKYAFRGEVYPIFMGYQRDLNLQPFGIQPLSRGQEFLLTYDERMKNFGVDTYYHDIEQNGMQFVSMTDYLLKSMVCGVSVEKQEEQLLENPIANFLGFSKPKFSAPRLPMRGTIDPCHLPEQRDQSLGQWNKGWSDPVGFYHHIEDSIESSKSYGGIVELLYNEIDFEKVPDFDLWWDQKVRPHFEDVMTKLYSDYIDEVVNKKMKGALFYKINDVENSYGSMGLGKFEVKQGYLAAMKNQLLNYFDQILEPKIELLEMDTSYVDPASEAEHRNHIVAEFNKIKTQFFQLFDYLTGETQKLTDPQLIGELESLREGLYSEVQDQLDYIAVGVRRELQQKKLAEVKFIRVLMEKKLTELRRILKSDRVDILHDVASLFVEAIRQDNRLSSEQREAAIEAVYEQLDDEEAAFDAEEDREGHVLANHKKKVIVNDQGEEIAYKPSGQITYKTIDLISLVTYEFIQLLGIRDTLQSLDEIDAEVAK